MGLRRGGDYNKLNAYGSAATATVGAAVEAFAGDRVFRVYGMKSSAGFQVPSGYSELTQCDANSAGLAMNVFYKDILADGTEAAASSTHVGSASATYRFCLTFVVKNPGAIDTALAGWAYRNSSPNKQIATIGGSASAANTLCVHVCCEDAWRHLTLDPGPMEIANRYVVDGQMGVAAAWTFEEALGPIDEFSWNLTRNINDGLVLLIPIQITGGLIPARADMANPCSEIIYAANDDGNGAFPWTGGATVATTITDIDGFATANATFGDEPGPGLNPSNYLSRINGSTADRIFLAEWAFDDGAYTGFAAKKWAFHPLALSGLYSTRLAPVADHGIVGGFRSGTNEYALYDMGGSDTRPQEISCVVVDAATPVMDETNTFDPADITAVVMGFHNVAGADTRVAMDNVHALNPVALIGGDDGSPDDWCDWETAYDNAMSAGLLTITKQGNAFETKHDINVGNGGANVTKFSTNGKILQSAPATGYEFQAAANAVVFDMGPNDVCEFVDPVEGGGTLDLTIGGDALCTKTFQGGAVNNLKSLTLLAFGTGAYNRFIVRNQAVPVTIGAGADISGIAFEGFTSTHVAAFDFADLTELNAVFAGLAGTKWNSNVGAIRLNYTGGGNLTGTTSTLPDGMTADGNGVDIILNHGVHDVALTIPTPVGSGWSTYQAIGAGTGSITYSVPTFDLDLASDVVSVFRVFETGTQSELETQTGTSFNWTHGNQTVDITVWAVVGGIAYQPQRLTNVNLTNRNVSLSFDMVDIPAYNGSHGLTYGVDLSHDRLTKVFSPLTRQLGADLVSALLDAWNAQAALHNTDFPVRMDGPKTAIFLNGATINGANLDNWRGAGIEYRDVTDAVTRQWASFVSTPVSAFAGATAEYQQTEGAGTTDARATGSIDQIVEIFNSGGSNFRGHMMWKFQVNGFKEAAADILELFSISELAPTEYVFAMSQTAIAAAPGDPGISLTITDYGASSVTRHGKQFGVVIVSDASGEDILRELDYNLAQDATYQGKDPFNWPEMVIEAGSGYETQRGFVQGNGVAVLQGVYVENSQGDAHPDFARFQSDDGTYFEPDPVASIATSGMPTIATHKLLLIWNKTALSAAAWAADTAVQAGEIRLRTTGLGSENVAGLFMRAGNSGTTGPTEPTWNTNVYGTTADNDVTWTTYGVLYYSQDPAAASFLDTYIDGQEFAAGEEFGYAFAMINAGLAYQFDEGNGFVQASGFAFAVSVTNVPEYADDGVDGSTLTARFATDVQNLEVDLIADADFDSWEMFAYYAFTQTLVIGLWHFRGGVLPEEGGYRIVTAKADIWLDETLGVFIKQRDNRRIYRDVAGPDGTYNAARDPTSGGGGIATNHYQRAYAVEVSGSLPLDTLNAAKAAAESADAKATSILVDTGTNLPAQISGISGGGGLDAAGVRAAIGMAAANLDTQLEGIDGSIGALNDLSAADVNAQVDLALADYDAATKAELDAAVAPLASGADLAAVGASVAAILLDTGTELPAQIGALNNLSQAQVEAAIAGQGLLTEADFNLAVAGLSTFDPATHKVEIAGVKNTLDELNDLSVITLDASLAPLASAAALAEVASDVDAISTLAAAIDAVTSQMSFDGDGNLFASIAAQAVEEGLTAQNLFQILLAMQAGQVTGANTSTEVYRTPAGVTRVTFTVDAQGNRSQVVFSLA